MTKLKCKNARKRLLIVAAVALLLLVAVSVAQPKVSVYAASSSSGGDVAGAVEETWGSAKEQIKRVVNNVIFPVVDTRNTVFRKTRHGVFRLPKARAVRVHRAVHIVCMSRVYAHRAAVYLENTRIRG